MYSEELKARVLAEIKAGARLRSVARKYDVYEGTVNKWCIQANIKAKQPRYKIPDKTKYDVIKLIEAGASIAEIAEGYNVTETSIRSWLANKNQILALYSTVNEIKSHTEDKVKMPRKMDEKDIKLENLSLKEENEYLKAKVAYLEELMKLSNIPAGNFKKNSL